MKTRNKKLLKEALASSTDARFLDYFLDTLSLSEKINLLINIVIKSKRACLLYSCIHMGMSFSSAYGYAFKKEMSEVVRKLISQSWDLSDGKL